MQEQAAAPSPQEEKSSTWKLQGVIFEPREAFRAIRHKSNWLLPLALATILGTIGSVMVVQTVGVEAIVEQQVEASGRSVDDISDQEYDLHIMLTRVATVVAPLVLTPIIVLCAAGIYLLCFMPLGGEGTYRRFFSVVSHVFFVGAVINTLGIGISLLALTPEDIDIRNPLMTNPGFLIERSESPVLHTFASYIDLRAIYITFLTGMGLAIASRLRTIGGGVTIAFLLYGVVALIFIGFAAVFG